MFLGTDTKKRHCHGRFGVLPISLLLFLCLSPVEAGLIAYLWPLLIVLMVGMTKSHSLSWTHLIDAVIAFIGTGIMLQSKEGIIDLQVNEAYHWTGYGAAFACALIWSSYSVVNQHFQSVPSSSVLWYCLVTTLLAGVSHFVMEKTSWSFPITTWIAILGLGLGLFTNVQLTMGQIVACTLITTGALFASLMPNKKVPSTL